MAGGLDHKSLQMSLQMKEKLKPATTSLQNCLKFSHNCKYFSLLCDFGIAIIVRIRESDISSLPQGTVHKKLEHGNGETLEGQSWSPDDGIYAVLGSKAYLYQVSNDFSLLYAIPLYYMPKDIAISTTLSESGETKDQLKYKIAIAGPNGVEIYDLEVKNSSINVKESLHLHADLAIVLVDFSPDLEYLAVAALDCHFGIWNVQSLEGEQKDFWYKHLSTVRITNMAFSHDSRSIAVACWDGVCYIYTKAQPSIQGSKSSCQWIQCNHIIQPSGERICGLLTGSLVCWAPDSKSVRFSFANEDGSWLNTLDIKDEKSWTEKIDKKGVEVKGMDSLRCQAGVDFSVCYLSSQQIILREWTIEDKTVISSKTHDTSREVRLYEDLTCSVSLVQNDANHTTGITMRWCCHGDEEVEQAKNLCEMIFLRGRSDEENFRAGIGNTRPAVQHCWNSSKKQDNNRKQESTSSAPPSSSSSTPSPTSSSSTSVQSSSCTVSAPFYEPSTLLSNLSVPNPRHFVLASRTCLILVVLPSLAYVYYRENKQWKSIMFGDAVIRCCLVQGSVLVTLSANGVLSAWHLTRSSSFTCLDSLQIQDLAERAFVVGDVVQSLLLVFDVDSDGKQRVIHVSLRGDTLALAREGPMCMVTPLESCSSMMLGVCVFFDKEKNSCSVLVPELNINYKMTCDERYSSLLQCIMENTQELLDFVISKKQSQQL